MIQDYKSKSAHIQDNGIFSELPRTLAKWFGRVTYSSPWINAFPSSKDTEVGEGSDKFDRVEGIAEVREETDLFIFPDTYYGKEQIELVNSGKRVWGSRNADELEIYRSEAKPYFDELGINQGEYELVKGVSKLRKYIKEHDNEKLWIKCDKTRGDMESFFVEGYELYKGQVDDLEYHLGPKAEIMTFVVEKHLEGTIDIAIDTHGVDGLWPSVALLGTEEKGEFYICAVKKWSQITPNLTVIYDKLSDTLKKYQCRNFISLESRAKGKDIKLGDPCMRGGSPPFELQMNMITNSPDVFWFGAEGKMIDPEYAAKYGVMLCVHSDWASKHPLMVQYPKKYREQIKFRYDSEFDGHTWIMPQDAGPRIAGIVAMGDSLDPLYDEVKEISEQMKGIQIESFTRSIPIAKEKLKELASWGIRI
ncbi:MAG: hypothetical protein ABSG90_12725 [Dehalococcoidia bacterium]|jgi:hypothetical protein